MRSALGLESSKWDQAGAFAVGLCKIEVLKRDRDDPVAKNQEYEWISEVLYNFVFDTVSKNKLETRRKCMWYFGRNVRPIPYFPPNNLIPITNTTTASQTRS